MAVSRTLDQTNGSGKAFPGWVSNRCGKVFLVGPSVGIDSRCRECTLQPHPSPWMFPVGSLLPYTECCHWGQLNLCSWSSCVPQALAPYWAVHNHPSSLVQLHAITLPSCTTLNSKCTKLLGFWHFSGKEPSPSQPRFVCVHLFAPFSCTLVMSIPGAA